jgi:hypothetical protein
MAECTRSYPALRSALLAHKVLPILLQQIQDKEVSSEEIQALQKILCELAQRSSQAKEVIMKNKGKEIAEKYRLVNLLQALSIHEEMNW